MYIGDLLPYTKCGRYPNIIYSTTCCDSKKGTRNMAKKSKNLTKLITYDQVKSKIIEIRDQKVILDSDVAELYDVETKRINESMKQ